MKYPTLALFAVIGLASAPALADRDDRYGRPHRFLSPDYAAAYDALEERDDLLQRRATTFRIGAVERQQITEQRQEIEDLQDQIEAGELIDRYTLFQALGGPGHVIYFDSDFS